MASLYDLLGSGQPSRMGMIEGDAEYDPWSMQAARYRARAPTRPAGIYDTNASRGFIAPQPIDEARQQAWNVATGDDYNPSSLFQMALGAVGAPGLVGGVPGLGSGVGRAKIAARAPAQVEAELTAAQKAATNPEAKFSQYAEAYPAAGPPTLEQKTHFKTGEPLLR